jgi:2-dehydropantoate 2-reductase
VTAHIREELWVKILGNVAFNPISVLTGATLARISADADVSSLALAIMAETAAVADRLGMKLPISIEQRFAGAAQVGEHKTSMLQDLEAGRPLELEPLVGAVLELGERLAVPLPLTTAVYACVKLLAAVHRSAQSHGSNH